VIPFLRDDSSPPRSRSRSPKSTASSKKLKIATDPAGGQWDNKALGLPISTYNENVHQSFKIGFNELNQKAYQTVTPSSKKTSKYL
jgi:hypothetical protein